MNFFARQFYFMANLGAFVAYHLTHRKRAIYVGCTDMKNLGDEAVYYNIRELFGMDLHLFKVSYNQRLASLSLMRKFSRSADVIILGGGTLISRGPEEGYLKLLLQVIEIFPSADVYVFGTGVSEVQLAAKAGIPTDVPAWSTVLNRCKGIAVRGHLSKGYLIDWRIQTPVSIAGDPAILSARGTVRRKRRNKSIAVNFCNIVGRIHGLDNAPVEKFGSELLERLIRDKWKVHLFPMTDTDLEFMSTTLLRGRTQEVNLHAYDGRISRALNFLESVDLFIGMRLHAVVFSNAVYTPFHAIEYHSKTLDYLDMMGLGDHVMRTDALDVEQAYEQLLQLYDHLDEEQDRMFDLMKTRKERLQGESLRFRSLMLNGKD